MECIEGLIMAAIGSFERVQALFGFLNMQPDLDGRIRRAHLGIQSQDEGKMYSMPAKAYKIFTGKDVSDKQMQQRLWIDYSIDWNKFQRISWKDLGEFLNERPGFFKDRMVLVGGEYEGSQDFHRIPKRQGLDEEVSGLVIQALVLNTFLQDKLIHASTGYFVFLPMAAVFMLFSAVFLIRPKVIPFAIIYFILLTGYIISAYFLFILNRQLLPVASPLLIMILTIVPIFLARRKLTFVVKPSAEGNKNEKF